MFFVRYFFLVLILMFYVVGYHTRTMSRTAAFSIGHSRTTMMEVLRRELAHDNQGSSDALDLCLLCDLLKMTDRSTFCD